MTGCSVTAHDLTQETLLQAWAKLSQLQEPARFGGWLRTVAANTCKMWLRRQTRDDVSLDELIGAGDEAPAALGAHHVASVQEEYEGEERRRAVRGAVARLSEKNRAAVQLHYFRGMTCREVASVLGVPVSTVAGRLHKSRKILSGDQQLRSYAIYRWNSAWRAAWRHAARHRSARLRESPGP
jgi:RNA polymerase sigma-70 factor (ECF subfamily)